MKNNILYKCLIVGAWLISIGASAQNMTDLHNFPSMAASVVEVLPPYLTILTNTGGGIPVGPLAVSSSNMLYGATPKGGLHGGGTLFRMKPDGSSFSSFFTFDSPLAALFHDCIPNGGLVVSSNTIYGTYLGQMNSATTHSGAVYAVNTDGTGFRILHSFNYDSGSGSYPDGDLPNGNLILVGNVLYGTTQQGGSWSIGVVFKVNTDGTGFTVLHNFTKIMGTTGYEPVEGEYPNGGLLAVGDTLYGTTTQGGSAYLNGGGTLFAINTNGTAFSVLHNFYSNAGVVGNLILVGNAIYGVTTADTYIYQQTGHVSGGTIYSINTNGTGFNNICVFEPLPTGVGTNYAGVGPNAGLAFSDGMLYDTTGAGGALGQGTIFGVSPDGGAFIKLNDFSALANSGLVTINGALYGTAEKVTTGSSGFIFQSTPPALGNIVMNGNVSWSYKGSKLSLNAGQISNFSTNKNSGTLKLVLWATASPYAGGDITGYIMGTATLGNLKAGFSFNKLKLSAAYTPPPPGIYFTALTVEEFDGTEYVIDDYATVANGSSETLGGGTESIGYSGTVTGNISFASKPTYTISATTGVNFKVKEVLNGRSSGISGNLHLQLWATTTPYTGGTISGYILATRDLGQLAAGYDYNAISGSVTYHPPPTGNYYLTVTLEEDDGASNYYIQDYLSSPKLYQVK